MRHTSAYADPPRASPNTSRLVVPRPFYMPPLLDPLCADSRLHCSVLAFHSFAASATPTTRVRHKRVTSQSQMTRAKTATDGDPYIRSHDHMIRRAYDHSGSGSRRLTPTSHLGQTEGLGADRTKSTPNILATEKCNARQTRFNVPTDGT